MGTSTQPGAPRREGLTRIAASGGRARGEPQGTGHTLCPELLLLGLAHAPGNARVLHRRLRRSRCRGPLRSRRPRGSRDSGAAPGGNENRGGIHVRVGSGLLLTRHSRRARVHPFSLPRRIADAAGFSLRMACVEHPRDPGHSHRGRLRAGRLLLGGDGEGGNGVFRKTRLGTNDLSWVAHLVAPKQTAGAQS